MPYSTSALRNDVLYVNINYFHNGKIKDTWGDCPISVYISFSSLKLGALVKIQGEGSERWFEFLFK